MKSNKVSVPLFLTVAFLLILTCSFAQQENRIALVIGVQNYVSVPPLRHSLNDASDMAGALKLKGFKVETLLNPKSKKEIKDAIARYYNIMRSQTGAVGIVYYAGHGIQFEGENYLIPTTANLQVPGDMEEQCVKMNTVMSVLNSSGTNLNILLLDACRTNAFPSFSRDIVKGLSNVEAPKGSIVVFATQPGTVASDGTGKNGLFTSKLLKYINEPNLNIGEVLKKVKQDVNTESGGGQLPSVVDNSTGGDFYFTKSASAARVQSNVKPQSELVNSTRQMYENGKDAYASQKFSEAASWFMKGAEQGYADAQFNLGRMYERGIGLPLNFGEAYKWYLKAAEQGNAPGQFALSRTYLYGIGGVTIDGAEGVKWCRLSADQEYGEAQFTLGRIYNLGEHNIPKDESAGAKWQARGLENYIKEAENNDADSQFQLAQIYNYGSGNVPKNESEAFKWYSKALPQIKSEAIQGESRWAQYRLGVMYRYGLGLAKNALEAKTWLAKAGEQGYVAAQTLLGSWYKNGGDGLSVNGAEAVKWYTMAAGQNTSYAKLTLGNIYREGIIVEQNYIEAIKWYNKAATEHSITEAEFWLGFMYLNGQGVTKDYKEAYKWLSLASDKQYPQAQTALGTMFENGWGVLANEAEALRLYNLAAAKDNFAQENIDRIAARVLRTQPDSKSKSKTTTCTGCPTTSPWSATNSSTCYAALSACQAAYGINCKYCH